MIDSRDRASKAYANSRLSFARTASIGFEFDHARNQHVEQAPAAVTTNTWDSENRLLEIAMPDGTRNTMLYRWDGLRTKLHDSEGDKRMVWDAEGSSGYQDLLDERQP